MDRPNSNSDQTPLPHNDETKLGFGVAIFCFALGLFAHFANWLSFADTTLSGLTIVGVIYMLFGIASLWEEWSEARRDASAKEADFSEQLAIAMREPPGVTPAVWAVTKSMHGPQSPAGGTFSPRRGLEAANDRRFR